MPIDAEPLRKILEFERTKGYDNSAVFGGLDKFLAIWATKAAGSLASTKLLARFRKLRLPNSNYASLNSIERSNWVAEVLTFLDDATKPPRDPKTVIKAAAVKTKVKAKGVLERPSLALGKAVTTVKGISVTTAAKLRKLGVETTRQLCYFFPHRHLDYSRLKHISELTEDSDETIIANVWQVKEVMLGRRRSTEAIVGDATGNIRVVWFNNPYLARSLTTNQHIVLSGRVSLYGGRFVFKSPEWEPLENKELVHTGRLVPVYPLTSGLKPRQMRNIMKEVADNWVEQVTDFLPPELVKRRNFLPLPEALKQAHFPDSQELKLCARQRLAFDELFLLQIGVLKQKKHWQEDNIASPLPADDKVLNSFIAALPFNLTAAQQKVLAEILKDMEQSRPMSRLLQGEVGSGKTVVAAAALLITAARGFQGALMAPTEILAEQHFASLDKVFNATADSKKEEGYIRRYYGILEKPLTIALLIGDIKGKEKKALQQAIASGEVDIAIGTHALIQKDTSFHKLGLAVIDEQHRFGVEQRAALGKKGKSPHLLIMTATPIPRTLALTLYGELDLSVIDELPPGRQIIKTKWLQAVEHSRTYNFISRQVEEGRQAFIICPLVEESEAIQAKAATVEYEILSRDIFPNLKLGLIHGRLSATAKDEVMRLFHDGTLNILVSTPVVEVGIDVPNATVMLVESADRFGVSQLHQFRGRVGRGEHQSYCLLLSDNPSEISKLRLDIIERIQDGFALAEEDLKLRGPGEFFGTRQSGLPDLKMARLTDVKLLETARREAQHLFAEDPELKKEENKLLVEEAKRVWEGKIAAWG